MNSVPYINCTTYNNLAMKNVQYVYRVLIFVLVKDMIVKCLLKIHELFDQYFLVNKVPDACNLIACKIYYNPYSIRVGGGARNDLKSSPFMAELYILFPFFKMSNVFLDHVTLAPMDLLPDHASPFHL